MALRPDQPGKRTCLRCAIKFDSRDAGNRICPKCDRANGREYVPTVVSTTSHTDGGSSRVGSDD